MKNTKENARKWLMENKNGLLSDYTSHQIAELMQKYAEQLSKADVSNNEVAVCDFCDKTMTNKTLRTCDEHAINRRM